MALNQICYLLFTHRTPAHTVSIQTSVGELQVVQKTPVWYLSITELKLLRAIILTWCCYNSYCPPCIRSQTCFPSFSRTRPSVHGAWCYYISYS